MKYLLLIYAAEKDWNAQSPAELAALTEEYAKFSQSLVADKVLVGGNRLQDSDTATTVRLRGGKPQLTDGPFAETREQLGGYYLIDVPDLDAALAVAARIPTARTGSVEVRPLHAM